MLTYAIYNPQHIAGNAATCKPATLDSRLMLRHAPFLVENLFAFLLARALW